MNMRMKLLGEGNMKVRPLNDAKAIDNGATFISESFLFSVAGGLILYESFRQRRKELVRREGVADDIRALQDEIEWLKTILQQKKVLNEEYHLPGGVIPSILKLEAENKAAPQAPKEQTNKSTKS
jgi:optic atrophy 3 protein